MKRALISTFSALVILLPAQMAHADYQRALMGKNGVTIRWAKGEDFRLLGRCKISNNKVSETVEGVVEMLPYVSNTFLGKGLKSVIKKYVTLEKGEGYCALAILDPGSTLPKPVKVKDVALHVRSFKDKKLIAQDKPSYWCGRIHKTGLCYEVLETAETDVNGISACAEGRFNGAVFSVSYGVGAVPDTVAKSYQDETSALSNKSCKDRGLAIGQ